MKAYSMTTINTISLVDLEESTKILDVSLEESTKILDVSPT
jgi:hypothetical protein